jgi:hypothetical protein
VHLAFFDPHKGAFDRHDSVLGRDDSDIAAVYVLRGQPAIVAHQFDLIDHHSVTIQRHVPVEVDVVYLLHIHIWPIETLKDGVE